MGNQPIWTRDNFLFSLMMLVGVAFGLTTDIANDVVAYLLGVVGLIGNIRLFLKDAKFVGVLEWLKNPNTWTYLAGIITAFSPQLESLIPALRSLFDAIITKNYGTILTALFALGSIIWGLVKNPPKPALA